jgi:ribosomal protein S18 acetylase RimI-like enzyme
MLYRIIGQEEAESFWQLRLEMLQAQPEAYGSAYEDSVGTPLEEVRGRMGNGTDSYILGAYTEAGELSGIVGFHRERGAKLRHKAKLWGVYVRPALRGKGVARGLLTEALQRAAGLAGLRQVTLAVVTTNQPAIRLYTGLGFEVYGTEPCALIYQGQSYDEHHMVYTLDTVSLASSQGVR